MLGRVLAGCLKERASMGAFFERQCMEPREYSIKLLPLLLFCDEPDTKDEPSLGLVRLVLQQHMKRCLGSTEHTGCQG